MRTAHKAFSLSELLIAMMILAQIATFTIPKVLTSQQNNSYRAIGKEAIAAVSEAYHLHTLKNGRSTSFSTTMLTPYLNYANVDNATTIDYMPQNTSLLCSDSASTCLRLHNGAILYFQHKSMGGSASTNGVWFLVDPDGKYSNTTNGPGKGLLFWLYYSGRVATKSTEPGPSCDNGGCGSGPNPALEPGWFSWN